LFAFSPFSPVNNHRSWHYNFFVLEGTMSNDSVDVFTPWQAWTELGSLLLMLLFSLSGAIIGTAKMATS